MTEIIAEIGVNWSGNFVTAWDMIKSSKHAGADAVKFQMFNRSTIRGSKHEEELSMMILEYDGIRYLSERAKESKIKFGVSVMYQEGFDILEALRLNNNILHFIKIRYGDRNNHKLAERAVDFCRNNDVPLMVSVRDFFMGSKLRYDTSDIYERYSFTNYMYCVPEYPPELSQINIEYINSKYFHGYSNHYPSKYIPMIAVIGDLKFVEIHVKRKTHNSVAISEGLVLGQIDENVSIDFSDLGDVCDFRNILSKMNQR